MKIKDYALWGKAVDSKGNTHYVTVVGRAEQEKVKTTLSTETTVVDENGKQHEGLLLTDYNKKVRTFTMARSICDPRDEFNFETGKQIAIKRLERGDKNDVIGSLQSENITMLNDDMCNLLVFNEVNHVIKNIDTYIGLNN